MGDKRASRVEPLTNSKFGRWLVIGPEVHSEGYKKSWLCRCECGTERHVNQCDLRSGKSTNCGCVRKQTLRDSIKHGCSRRGLSNKSYETWKRIKDRCYNPNSPDYYLYGARGIKVCERWLESFNNFYDDMGDRQPLMSIDRIDSNGDYGPENCRWADSITQGNNTSRVRLFEHDGKKLGVSQWARVLGITREKIKTRMAVGYSFEEAINPDFQRRKAPQPKGFKLDEHKVRDIRRKFLEGSRNADLARQYQVSSDLIKQIKRGKVWANVV